MEKEKLEELKKKVRKEVLNYSWRENHLNRMGKDRKKIAQRVSVTTQVTKDVEIFLEYDKNNYPHHILGGDTWNEFSKGFLRRNPKTAEQIKNFYKEDYKLYLENTNNLESNCPVWIIGEEPELAHGEVLPMAIDYKNGTKLIILFINKGGAE